jgi:hypothetical protein
MCTILNPSNASGISLCEYSTATDSTFHLPTKYPYASAHQNRTATVRAAIPKGLYGRLVPAKRQHAQPSSHMICGMRDSIRPAIIQRLTNIFRRIENEIHAYSQMVATILLEPP